MTLGLRSRFGLLLGLRSLGDPCIGVSSVAAPEDAAPATVDVPVPASGNPCVFVSSVAAPEDAAPAAVDVPVPASGNPCVCELFVEASMGATGDAAAPDAGKTPDAGSPVVSAERPRPRPRPRPRLPRGRPRGRRARPPRPASIREDRAAAASPCSSIFTFFSSGPVGAVGPVVGTTGTARPPSSGGAAGSPARSFLFCCCFSAFLAAFSAFFLLSSSSSSISDFTSMPAAIFLALSLAFFFALFSTAPALIAWHEHGSSKTYSYFVPSFWHFCQRSHAFWPM